ncbi:hypothetical protein [Rhodoferax sp.]|uniref:hypothetical protein n=1 Tax=Rhodoferax sp. TaxID=50421 RepID=UPI002602D6FA|nr:hypothetical protein [Rhodoferax sp.]MDD2924647.1 hypothetical protein [Rhodoferax sp.]
MSVKVRAAHTARYDGTSVPTRQDKDETRHWVTRAANFVVVATQAVAGTTLQRTSAQQVDEYMVLLPEDVAGQFEAGGEVILSPGDSLTIVPPGDSSVTVPQGGWVYRVFSQLALDLLAQADNASQYADGAPDVAPLTSWPAPVGGYRLRHYALADHVRSDTTMRLFRSCNLMVNIFLPSKAPRDVRKMTPHSHTDFEQGSLAVRGRYIHHLRYPWTPDLTTWREDEHGEVGSPSLLVVPPKVIHTSQAIGTAGMRLVDIFAPPRDDFSLKPGLVCNAAEYPLPERLQGVAGPVSAA